MRYSASALPLLLAATAWAQSPLSLYVVPSSQAPGAGIAVASSISVVSSNSNSLAYAVTASAQGISVTPTLTQVVSGSTGTLTYACVPSAARLALKMRSYATSAVQQGVQVAVTLTQSCAFTLTPATGTCSLAFTGAAQGQTFSSNVVYSGSLSTQVVSATGGVIPASSRGPASSSPGAATGASSSGAAAVRPVAFGVSIVLAGVLCGMTRLFVARL